MAEPEAEGQREEECGSAPETRKLLGNSFRMGRKVWCVLSEESVKQFKTRIRELTGRNTGRSRARGAGCVQRMLGSALSADKPELAGKLA